MASSSQLTFPVVSIGTHLETRQTSRSSWERDFESNLPVFVEALASGILRDALSQLNDRLANPFQKALSEKRPFRLHYNLDFTTASGLDFSMPGVTVSSKIKELVGGEASQLPPFRDWLERFDCKQKESDTAYFQELIRLVGRQATDHIHSALTECCQQSESQSLRFRVEWISKLESSIGNPSDFRDLCIAIQFWLPKGLYQQEAEPTSGPTLSVLSAHRQTTSQLQRKQSRNQTMIGITAIVCLALALVILKAIQSPSADSL